MRCCIRSGGDRKRTEWYELVWRSVKIQLQMFEQLEWIDENSRSDDQITAHVYVLSRIVGRSVRIPHSLVAFISWNIQEDGWMDLSRKKEPANLFFDAIRTSQSKFLQSRNNTMDRILSLFVFSVFSYSLLLQSQRWQNRINLGRVKTRGVWHFSSKIVFLGSWIEVRTKKNGISLTNRTIWGKKMHRLWQWPTKMSAAKNQLD
jgi:hypothetical protein